MKNWIWILLVGLLAGCGQAEETSPVPSEAEVLQAAPLETVTPFLLSVEQVQEKLDAPGWVWLDVRTEEAYNKGHIPGAIQIYRPDFQSTAHAYKGMMPAKSELAAKLSEKGISPGDTLILYDNDGNVNAARLWWLLHQFGHEQAVLLHGGYRLWTNRQLPIDTLTPTIQPKAYLFANEEKPTLHISKEEVLAAMDDPNYLIVDTRSWEEYSGQQQKAGASRPGHIPGSIWCDYIYTLNYDGDYTFRSVAELAQLFTEKGITKDKTIITYCHTGVRSALTLYVLQELLHYPDVRNYDGSWVEWSYHPELPVAIVDTLMQ